MAQTFTEIIFPPKPKPKTIIVPPATPKLGIKVLDYWFREVNDHIDKTRVVHVMVKCPACGEVYSLMTTTPDRVEHLRKCLQDHDTYYYNYARIRCPKCRGVLAE